LFKIARMNLEISLGVEYEPAVLSKFSQSV
jgi:hypothetical protein